MTRLRWTTRFTVAALAAAWLGLAASATAQSTSVGLSTVRAQRHGNPSAAGFVPQAADYFGYSMAVGDFNGDDVDDLAVGMPFDNGAGAAPIADSGSVVVRYGASGAGLAGAPQYLEHRELREAGDEMGRALAACDFNGDDFDDLAVGIANEDYLGERNAGIVQVHFGYTTGLPTVADVYFAQSTPGVPEDNEVNDWFGWSLACADFDGDTFDDLAIGLPGETYGWDPLELGAGRVIVVPGSPVAGLDFDESILLDQDTDGMPNEGDDGDAFGLALAAGDFDGDGFGDLAIGAPFEDDNAGGVGIVMGGPAGLSPSNGAEFLGENVLGGTRESGDTFGATLATGDLNGDGFDDLVIGIPAEDADASIPNSGQVGVLYGGEFGFHVDAQLWTESAVFGAGTSESGDAFGTGLALGDFDRDGADDLAIGHPGEYVSGIHDGAVTVLMGNFAAFGRIEGDRRRSFAAGVQGVPGDPFHYGEQLGHALAAGDFDGDGHADLVMGAPGEDAGGLADVGASTLLHGALFADGAESGNTNLWSQTVSFPNGNTTRATTAAKLGPPGSRFGLQVDLYNPTALQPGAPTYVRVGPEAGFFFERALSGQFFINPQNLTMSTTAGQNVFQMMAFTDGLGTGSKTRLAFDLVRTATTYSLVANFWSDATNSLQLAGAGVIADANPNDPALRNVRIEYDWAAGNPGRLTVWRTRFVNGAPDSSGRVQLFAVDLPNTGSAGVFHVLAGMVVGQDRGTFGALYLDEISVRR